MILKVSPNDQNSSERNYITRSQWDSAEAQLPGKKLPREILSNWSNTNHKLPDYFAPEKLNSHVKHVLKQWQQVTLMLLTFYLTQDCNCSGQHAHTHYIQQQYRIFLKFIDVVHHPLSLDNNYILQIKFVH